MAKGEEKGEEKKQVEGCFRVHSVLLEEINEGHVWIRFSKKNESATKTWLENKRPMLKITGRNKKTVVYCEGLHADDLYWQSWFDKYKDNIDRYEDAINKYNKNTDDYYISKRIKNLKDQKWRKENNWKKLEKDKWEKLNEDKDNCPKEDDKDKDNCPKEDDKDKDNCPKEDDKDKDNCPKHDVIFISAWYRNRLRPIPQPGATQWLKVEPLNGIKLVLAYLYGYPFSHPQNLVRLTAMLAIVGVGLGLIGAGLGLLAPGGGSESSQSYSLSIILKYWVLPSLGYFFLSLGIVMTISGLVYSVHVSKIGEKKKEKNRE